MGYTHYWRQQRDFTDNEWQDLTARVTMALKALPDRTETAGGYHAGDPLKICGGMGEGEPVIDGERIWFNGDESADLDHETFNLEKVKDSSFDFCKTARKPYDLLVTVVLVLADMGAPGALHVSSDGDAEEWQCAHDFVRETFTSIEHL